MEEGDHPPASALCHRPRSAHRPIRPPKRTTGRNQIRARVRLRVFGIRHVGQRGQVARPRARAQLVITSLQ
jgi:hypothetical protein